MAGLDATKRFIEVGMACPVSDYSASVPGQLQGFIIVQVIVPVGRNLVCVGRTMGLAEPSPRTHF